MAHEWTALDAAILPEGMYAETCGSGPTVVLIAGNGGATAFWYPVAKLLADHVTLVAIDYRDAPMRDEQGGLFETAVRKASDVPALLDALGLGSAIILGHSTGAQAAARAAAANPDRVSHLIFSGGYAASHPFMDESFKLRKAILQKVGPEAFMLDGLYRAVPPEKLFKQLETEGPEKMLAFRSLPDVEIESARIDQICDGDIEALLSEITVPATVLHAEDDAVFPYPLGQSVASAIKGAALIPVPSGGHLAPMLAPDVYGPILLGVLTS